MSTTSFIFTGVEASIVILCLALLSNCSLLLQVLMPVGIFTARKRSCGKVMFYGVFTLAWSGIGTGTGTGRNFFNKNTGNIFRTWRMGLVPIFQVLKMFPLINTSSSRSLSRSRFLTKSVWIHHYTCLSVLLFTGAYMASRACMAKGVVCGKGGHVW